MFDNLPNLGSTCNDIRTFVCQYAVRVIPPRDPVLGCIPPGRYQSSLLEIRSEFVTPYAAVPESQREVLWLKFEKYLEAWDVAEKQAGRKLLLGFWFSGSFITTRDAPSDIDLTVIYDAAAVSDTDGKQGHRELSKLAGLRHRDQVDRYGVQIFPIPWRSIASTLYSEKLNWHDSQYLVKLGALDDFWQRTPPEIKAAPIAPLVKAERGYVEVMF